MSVRTKREYYFMQSAYARHSWREPTKAEEKPERSLDGTRERQCGREGVKACEEPARCNLVFRPEIGSSFCCACALPSIKKNEL